ncbi:TPA: tryptophan 2,3-dioxygenase family protein [Providencia rettgeri]
MDKKMNLASKDFSTSLLPGEGKNDYEKYIRTKTLLSLQRTKEDWLHRDELIFQITHQSTELWLKLNNEEITEAIHELQHHRVTHAIALIQRAKECIHLVTEQISILNHLTPHDFLTIRPAFGTGSGMDSPGWHNVTMSAKALYKQFQLYIKEKNIDLIQVYTKSIHDETFNLCEALIGWDEQTILWRMRHYQMVIRTIGHNSIGTKGTMSDTMAQRIYLKHFPQLWKVRSTLTMNANQYVSDLPK